MELPSYLLSRPLASAQMTERLQDAQTHPLMQMGVDSAASSYGSN